MVRRSFCKICDKRMWLLFETVCRESRVMIFVCSFIYFLLWYVMIYMLNRRRNASRKKAKGHERIKLWGGGGKGIKRAVVRWGIWEEIDNMPTRNACWDQESFLRTVDLALPSICHVRPFSSPTFMMAADPCILFLYSVFSLFFTAPCQMGRHLWTEWISAPPPNQVCLFSLCG